MAVEKPRKRQLELDEDYGEGEDQFDADSCAATRRGAKEARRVSGVMREIKSLQNIGVSADVMEKVFDRLSLKDVMWAGSLNTKWYILACHILRKRAQDTPILRLWNAEKYNPNYLWMEWDLHFHEQLLAGVDEDEPIDGPKYQGPTFPCIDAIFSVGNRYAYDQFIHEDARLPFRQDHLFLTCGDAIITTPDFSYTGRMDGIFPWGSLTVQSLFIPKSPHFSIKAFALDAADTWNLDTVKAKVEFPVEDVGEGLELKGVFCMHWNANGPTMGFVDTLRTHYKNVGLLSGIAEELGCNRGYSPSTWAVGYSIYGGPEAEIGVYEVDWEQTTRDAVLEKMEKQAKAHRHGICIVLTVDNRTVEVKDDEANDVEDWSTSYRPPSVVNEVLAVVRKRLPRVPILGVNSEPIFVAETVNKDNTNVPENAEKLHCYGFLLITWKKL